MVAGSAPGSSQSWDGFLEIYRQLTQPLPNKPGWGYGVQDWYTAVSAASNIPNLNLPPVSLICGFLGLYMLAIGPINYLVVMGIEASGASVDQRACLRPMRCIHSFSGGQPVRGNRSVRDGAGPGASLWPTSDQARVTGIVGLFAPQRAVYVVKADQVCCCTRPPILPLWLPLHQEILPIRRSAATARPCGRAS